MNRDVRSTSVTDVMKETAHQTALDELEPSAPASTGRLFGWITLLMVGAALWLVPATAAAQEGAPPLKMTFVDATPNQSGQIRNKLQSIISGSNDINYTKASDFLFQARKYNVTLDTLGDTGLRTEQKTMIKNAMRASDLESMIVYKRVGQTLHLIVIGPQGNELRHFRSEIQSPQISDKQAVGVLRKLFQVLVPEVRSFRESPASSQPAPPPPSKEQSAANTPEEQLKDKVVKEHKDSHGNLDKHIALNVSPVFGRRSLNLQTDNGVNLTHTTPFFGFGTQVSGVFGLVESDTAAFGGTAFFDFAPFTTKFSKKEDAKEFKGTLFRGGLTLRYLSGVASKLIVYGQIGGEAMNLGLESNPTYVGSTYFSFLGGVGLIYRISPAADLEVEANVLPTALTNTNDRAYGTGAFSVGFNSRAAFSLDVWQTSGYSLFLKAYYDFMLMNPNHPEPRDYDTAATGSDTLHMGGAAVGFEF